MQVFPAAAGLVASATLTATAMAEEVYTRAIPDIGNIYCRFDPASDAPAVFIEIWRDPTKEKSYSWEQVGFPFLPVLAIYRSPRLGDPALTTVLSADVMGEIGMISYQPEGRAVLSKHYKAAGEDIHWTVQVGQCTETGGDTP